MASICSGCVQILAYQHSVTSTLNCTALHLKRSVTQSHARSEILHFWHDCDTQICFSWHDDRDAQVHLSLDTIRRCISLYMIMIHRCISILVDAWTPSRTQKVRFATLFSKLPLPDTPQKPMHYPPPLQKRKKEKKNGLTHSLVSCWSMHSCWVRLDWAHRSTCRPKQEWGSNNLPAAK